MKFFDLEKQYKRIKPEIDIAITRVLERGDFIQGVEVKKLEQKLSEFVGSECLTVGNGTDALFIALLSMEIGPGDEVIAPSFTWVSTIEAIKLTGALPVYCDVDYETYNIDPKEVKDKLTDSTKAILAVSLFGQCADLKELKKIADKNNIYLIEDAAQSFGAEHYRKKSCSIAHVSTTSFYPTKPLSCFGDGGAIFSNNKEIFKKASILSKNGQLGRYNYLEVGVNSRLDTIQASILLEKIKIFEEETKAKQHIARLYEDMLSSFSFIETPKIKEFNNSVFALYTLKVKSDQRDKVHDFLKENNIPCGKYYPVGVHKSKPYKNKEETNLEVTENLNKSALSLPMHPYIDENDIDSVKRVLSKY